MSLRRLLPGFLALALAACGQQDSAPAPPPSPDEARAPAEAAAPAPGIPGGLPDDRTPIPEAPVAATSAQGAAQVVQTYYALLEARRYADAQRLWSDEGRASGMSETAFAESFAKYAEHHAEVGAPGRIEGAAGSLYVEVPVVVYGRLKSGEPFRMAGPVTLRRVNDVPGSTPEQRLWSIASSGVRPRPAAAEAPKSFFVGRWAAKGNLCRDGAWVFTQKGLSTAGEVSCTFDRIRDTAAGVEIDATCTAQAPPERHTLRLAYAESAKALLVEGGPFADIGLVRCTN